ncbi:MAG: M20/M25/M40 family metallo-hydrolase [Terriglobales bacterium]
MSIFRSCRQRNFCLAVVSFLAILLIPVSALAATDDPDLTVVTEIRQEGFRHSQVMDILSELTDRIGPRLTGSPNVKKANEWTRDKLTEFGLANAHLEPWGPFGRGWSNEFTSVRMIAPDVDMLYALPKAWTLGTDGAVKSDVVLVKIESKEDLEKYRGKLAGKIVLLDLPKLSFGRDVESGRYDAKQLDEIVNYTAGNRYESIRAMILKSRALSREVNKFMQEEKVLATVEASRGEGGLLFVQGTEAYKKDVALGVPALVMAAEHFGRLQRLLERNVPVQLEVDVRNKFYDDDPMQYDTIAEIPGTDKKDEIVMLGGHLDSWHAGTGATDNGAGVAVVMEAVRILKAIGVKPRRTIRVGLWTGEEEGLLGSKGYVAAHFGEREKLAVTPATAEMPEYMRPKGKLVLKPEQQKVSAYFNLDNGTGRIRGVYTQENAAVKPIFEKWFEPFSDLSATTITMRNTTGTDHLSFDEVDIPGFQFIQDPLDYETRTHHSNMDVYERASKEDLMEAAVIMASFVYDAATRDQMMPRKPVMEENTPRKTNVAATPGSVTSGGGGR